MKAASPGHPAPGILLLVGAHAGVLALLLLPVWLFDSVPMPDFFGHLARIHVLATIDTDPALAEIYKPHWALYPNLMLDLFGLGATHVMPLVTAGKLFISLSFALWMGGTAWLHFLLYGRASYTPLLGSLFVLNAFSLFGFLNFTFGSGVVLTGLAAWVAMMRWTSWRRILCFIPIAIIAYLSHLMAFAILACCIFGYELGAGSLEQRFSLKPMLRRLSLATLPLVPVILLYIFVTPHESHGGVIEFGTLQSILFRPLLASNLLLGQPFKQALVFFAALYVLGLLTRTITIDRRMLVVLGGLGVAAFLCPTKLLTGAFVHIRLPAIIGCLLVASTEWHVGRLIRAVAGLLLATLLGYRALVIAEAWSGFDRTYAGLEKAVDTMDPGSKIFLAKAPWENRTERKAQSIYSHFLDLMSVERQIFSPRVFAWPGQHPLRHTEAYRDLGANSAFQGVTAKAPGLQTLAQGDPHDAYPQTPYLKRWQCNFDYVAVIHGKTRVNPAPALLLQQAAGERFTVYKVIPDSPGCPTPKSRLRP